MALKRGSAGLKTNRARVDARQREADHCLMRYLAQTTFLVGIVLVTVRSFAQAPVTASDDPESLFTSPDPTLNANKQVVLHIVRDLLEANHWDQADQYITKEYTQHNPLVASGLDPVVKFFGSRKPTPIPDAKSWKTKVVSVTAEGDRVVVAFVRELPDPRNPGKTYTTTWFDMWRIKDGKADEHWDGATIPTTRPAAGR
jgi:predicted SnoaL-like aldol condensation-catalyzing enzyme